MLSRFAIFAIGLIALLGCDTEHHGDDDAVETVVTYPGSITTNDAAAKIEDLSDCAVLIAVGKERLTKREFDKSVSAIQAIMRKQSRSESDFSNRWVRVCRQIPWDVASDFLNCSAISLEAETLGLTVSADDITASYRQLDGLAKALKKNRDEYIEEYTAGRDSVEAEFHRRSLVKQYFSKYLSQKLKVTDSEVDELHRGLVERNKSSDQTNADLRKTLSNFCCSAKPDLLSKLTGDETHDVNFLPPKVRCVLLEGDVRTSLPDEESTMPILENTPKYVWSEIVDSGDTFDAYCITNTVKVDRNIPKMFYGFRVFVDKDLGYVVPEKSKLKADIAMRKNQEVVKPLVDSLCLKYGLTFPHGICWGSSGQTVFTPVSEIKKPIKIEVKK